MIPRTLLKRGMTAVNLKTGMEQKEAKGTKLRDLEISA